MTPTISDEGNRLLRAAEAHLACLNELSAALLGFLDASLCGDQRELKSRSDELTSLERSAAQHAVTLYELLGDEPADDPNGGHPSHLGTSLMRFGLPQHRVFDIDARYVTILRELRTRAGDVRTDSGAALNTLNLNDTGPELYGRRGQTVASGPARKRLIEAA